MMKIYFNQLRRLLAVLAVCVMAISASATPYKNIHVQLNANESGRGKVYIRTEDPSNQQTRKSESVTLKATIGENGNDLAREEGDPLRGLYMIWLYGEPEDGYELAGFSLVKKNDGEYTKADLIASTYTDNGNFEDPFAAEKVDEDYEFIFNANCPREVDADSNNFASADEAREAARALDNWNEEPDHVIYAVFVPKGTVLQDGDSEGVESVKASDKQQQAYTLLGTKASSAQKGILIVNGKKIVR